MKDAARNRYVPVQLAVSAALAVAVTLAGCSSSDVLDSDKSPVDRGQHLVYTYGCGSCHSIPGIRGADGSTGPALNGIANRIYIAGLLLNTPGNLAQWIKNPQQVEVGSAMPDLGITSEQASDIAAFLYTLR